MIDIVNYFNDNKKNILDRIEEEKYIFPKMFLNEVELIHDSDLYKTVSNDPTFGNLFLIEQIRIFNIERIKDIYAFKSDKKYKIICLPFSTFEMAYLNDKQIKDQLFVNYNSEDEIFFKGDFLKISYIEKTKFDFSDVAIPYYEKNLFSDLKRKKYLLKNTNFFKKLF